MLSKDNSISIGTNVVKPTQNGSVPPPNENYMFSRAVFTRAVSFTPVNGNEPVVLMGGELNSSGNMATAFSTAANHGMHLGLMGGNVSDYDYQYDRGGKYNRLSNGATDGSMPYRPMPGIKDIQIQYQGGGMKIGATRTAEMNWTCWTWEELNRLIPHFLHHGRTILLEWGWTGESTTLREVKPYPLFTKDENNHLKFNLNHDDNTEFGTKDIISKLPSYILKQNGQYDAMLGIIQNFTWTVRDDGGFDCTTTLITPGVSTLQQNFKSTGEENLSFLPVLASPVPGWFNDTSVMKTPDMFHGELLTEETFTEASDSKVKTKLPNQMFKKLMPYVNFKNFIADLPDQCMNNYQANDSTRTSASIIMIKPFKFSMHAVTGGDFRSGIKPVFVDPAVYNPDAPEGQSYQPLFVTWGWIEDNVLSRFFSSIGRDSENNLKTIGFFRSIEHLYADDGTEITKVDRDNLDFDKGNFPQSTKIRRSTKMLTADTSKWILFNDDTVSEKILQNVIQGDEGKERANVRRFSPKFNSNVGGDIGGDNNEGLCKENEGFLRNIYFNVNWLAEVMSGASSIQDAVMSVWDEFAVTYGGVHRFRIEIEDDGNQVVIRDMGYQGMTIKDLIASVSENKTKKDGSPGDMNKLFEFPTWEMGSIVKSQNISAKIPTRMQLAAMYGSNNPNGIMAKDTGGDYDTLSALAWGRLNKPKLPEDANDETLEQWKRAHHEDLISGKWDSPNLHNRSFGVANASPGQKIYVGEGDGNPQPINNGTVVYPTVFNEIKASQKKEVIRRIKNKKDEIGEESFSVDRGGRRKTFWEGVADTFPGKIGQAAVAKGADLLGIMSEEEALMLGTVDLDAAKSIWQTFDPKVIGTNKDGEFTSIFNSMYIQSYKKEASHTITNMGGGTMRRVSREVKTYNETEGQAVVFSMKLGGEYLTVMKAHMQGDSTGVGNNTDPIVPIDFELEIDGTGGIFPGNSFQSSYLPEQYKKQTCFQVIGASHTISPEGWTTNIKGQIRVAMRDMKEEKLKDAKNNPTATNMTDMTSDEKENHVANQISGDVGKNTNPIMDSANRQGAELMKKLGYTPPTETPTGFESYGGVQGYMEQMGEAPDVNREPMKSMGFQESSMILNWMEANGIEPGKPVSDDFMEAFNEHIYQGSNPYGIIDWNGAVNNWSQTVTEVVNTAPSWTTAATMGSANRIFRRSGGLAGETFEWDGKLWKSW